MRQQKNLNGKTNLTILNVEYQLRCPDGIVMAISKRMDRITNTPQRKQILQAIADMQIPNPTPELWLKYQGIWPTRW